VSKFQRHFFVCTFDRAAEASRGDRAAEASRGDRAAEASQGAHGSCAAGGAREILARLQSALFAHPELWAEVSVTQAGCMGLCTLGPAIVVYPEGVWYVGVGVGDVDEIVREHLMGGRVVARLVHQWPEP